MVNINNTINISQYKNGYNFVKFTGTELKLGVMVIDSHSQQIL